MINFRSGVAPPWKVGKLGQSLKEGRRPSLERESRIYHFTFTFDDLKSRDDFFKKTYPVLHE